MAPTGYFLQKETKATKGGWTYGRWRVARSETASLPSLTSVRKAFVGDRAERGAGGPDRIFFTEGNEGNEGAMGLRSGGG